MALITAAVGFIIQAAGSKLYFHYCTKYYKKSKYGHQCGSPLFALPANIRGGEEHTSLLRQIINYGRKYFYSKSPRVTELGLVLQNLIGVSIYILE